jgi:DNA-binding GntR family transcriptional regulator
MNSTIVQQLHAEGSLKLDRSSLKDQIVEILREQITFGRLPPDAKLAEKEIAESLGVSRMPVRDALMELEREGLVVTKPGGRCVVRLNEQDIRNLFQMRMVLEKLAVELAALHNSPGKRTALLAGVQRMERAIERKDRTAYIRSDLEAHQVIWGQAENPYLLNMLNSITGQIIMFIASHAEYADNWHETLDLHRELVDCICSGDVQAACASIERHLGTSFDLSLRVLDSQPASRHAGGKSQSLRDI